MALLFADLHLHSKYSRAVSPNMDLKHIFEGAKKKGLQIMGTGDFTHPKWLQELKSELVENEGNPGMFALKNKSSYSASSSSSSSSGSSSDVSFILQAEVSTFFSDPAKGLKKVHHILFAPSFDAVDKLNERLGKMGNLSADGRPMFGKCSCAHLVEICKEADSRIQIVPAHIWTPWFSVFGSNSGYDSIEEAYEEQAKHIFALETGMSSDPVMNWRISKLDKYALISNSDSHSFYSFRLGRECNAFEFGENELNYDAFFDAIRKKDKKHFKFTVEVDPAYGKYHVDGHRNCKFSCSPSEAIKLKNICPVCKRSLTLGVEHRVEQLADRETGFVPEGAIPFKKLLPLQELVAACFSSGLASKSVYLETEKLISRFGSELNVLLNVSENELKKETHEKIANAILLNREGKLFVKPGFDGEYGILQLTPEMKISEKVDENAEKKENGRGKTESIGSAKTESNVLGKKEIKSQKSLGDYS